MIPVQILDECQNGIFLKEACKIFVGKVKFLRNKALCQPFAVVGFHILHDSAQTFEIFGTVNGKGFLF